MVGVSLKRRFNNAVFHVRKWRVSNIVFALWFGALLAGSDESFAMSQANCALDKGAFLFNGNLAFGEPHRKIGILNFTSQRFEFTHSTDKVLSLNSVITPQGKAAVNQSTNQNADKSNQGDYEGDFHINISKGAFYVIVFTVGLIIGLIFTMGQGKRGQP